MRRHTPFEELDAMFERMGRGFDADWFDFARPGAAGAVDVDVRTDDESVVVMADLPGFEREEIDVSLADRTLTIRADRTAVGADEDWDDGDADYVRRERRHESVSRRIRLPVEVDDEGTAAIYNNGVLTVTLPRVDDGDGHVAIDVE